MRVTEVHHHHMPTNVDSYRSGPPPPPPSPMSARNRNFSTSSMNHQQQQQQQAQPDNDNDEELETIQEWVCDCCHVAVFHSFVEAAQHEQLCRSLMMMTTNGNNNNGNNNNGGGGVDFGNADMNTNTNTERGAAAASLANESNTGSPPSSACCASSSNMDDEHDDDSGSEDDDMEEVKEWICDKCGEAVFSNYDEALAHEVACSGTDNNNNNNDENESENEKLPQPSDSPAIASMVITPVYLALDQDKYWLSELRCLVRTCIEVFTAAKEDICDRSQRGGTKRPIQLGRIGLRCRYCTHLPAVRRAKGAVSYPHSIRVVHQSVRNWLRYHFRQCSMIPHDIVESYSALQTARSHSGNASLQYWEDSARAIGMMDTVGGIFYGEPVPLPFGEKELLRHSENDEPKSLILEEDRELAPNFFYFLFSQQQTCRYMESDSNGRRKVRTVGYPGYECRHCAGRSSAGRYFPLNVNAMANFSHTHMHIMKCRQCPPETKEKLERVFASLDKDAKAFRGRWKRKFFEKIWGRIYGSATTSNPKPVPKLRNAVEKKQISDATAAANLDYQSNHENKNMENDENQDAITDIDSSMFDYAKQSFASTNNATSRKQR